MKSNRLNEMSDILLDTWQFNGIDCSKLIKNMNKARKTGAFCDIVLKVEDKEFHAHRCVLASCSDYFNAMFTNGVGFRDARRTGKPV